MCIDIYLNIDLNMCIDTCISISIESMTTLITTHVFYFYLAILYCKNKNTVLLSIKNSHKTKIDTFSFL